MGREAVEILFQDEYLVAAFKPPGIGVHSSDLIRERRTFSKLLEAFLHRPVWTIHRLDRPTSGVILFALEASVARAMSGSYWHEHVRKEYLAIVRGFPPDQGCIDIPLKRYPRHVHQSRRDAPLLASSTRYRSIRRWEIPLASTRYRTSRFSLLEVSPESGRYHQIRRHLARIGYPIIGDTQHGDTRSNEIVNTAFGHTRLMLHCCSLSFLHPVTQVPSEARAPIPGDMEALKGALEACASLD